MNFFLTVPLFFICGAFFENESFEMNILSADLLCWDQISVHFSLQPISDYGNKDFV